ncbi:hypothetical protein [Aquidulcibacter sp.]|uniref:hypothetical protein n=1 Tax=Aquidulcibacter sp. TaxID=2052990 RepID=UPI0028B15F21|nr:hypothetical protein [Aquidulcibacter sp.]
MNWRIYLLGGLLAAMFALSMYIAHLQTEMTKAKKAADVARAQTVVSEATAQAVDRVTLTERRITNEVHYVEKQIEALPSGEALVPDDVARIWGDGIDSLRSHSTNAQDHGAAKSESVPKD